MLEPGDINVNALQLYPRQGPRPEPADFLRGIPQFQTTGYESQRVNVGEIYGETIKLKGKRDIKIVFAEQNRYDDSKWNRLAEFTLDEGTAGFQLTVEVKSRHFKGTHHFKYTATNARGTAILERDLFINQEQCGGCIII